MIHRSFAILLSLATVTFAQETAAPVVPAAPVAPAVSEEEEAAPPVAKAVDEEDLKVDAGTDFFNRAKNMYDVAQMSKDADARRGWYTRSAELFSTYVSIFPNHANAEASWWYLGNSYYQAGVPEDAKRAFSTLLGRYHKGKWVAAACYTLAADHYNKGDYEAAAPYFKRFADNTDKPEDKPRGYFYAGNCFKEIGSMREAEECYLKVVNEPSAVQFIGQAKLAIGLIRLKANKEPEALALFQDVMNSVAPAKFKGQAALQIGLIHTKLGQLDVAEQNFRYVLDTPDTDEFRADAQIALMSNFLTAKNYAGIVDIFMNKPVKAEGEKEAARLLMAGRAFMKQGKQLESLNLFREVEQLSPDTKLGFEAAYYRLMNFSQLDSKNLDEQVDAFLELYRKKFKEDPRLHTALMMKAEYLFGQKKMEEAAKVYGEIDSALISEKNRNNLLFNRGWCLCDVRDYQGAIRSLDSFLEMTNKAEPRYLSALAKRGDAYIGLNENDKGIADFETIIANSTAAKDLQAFAYMQIARTRRTQNKLDEMIQRYQIALEKIPAITNAQQSEAYYWIGFGMVKINKAKEAEPFLIKARTQLPKSYAKNAGLLLALSYYAEQNIEKLGSEINTAIKEGYVHEIPTQTVQWAAMQAFNNHDFQTAQSYLAIISNQEQPETTAKEIWRYLGKAQLELGNAKDALNSIEHAIDQETDPAWKADSLVDRGMAKFQLKQFSKANEDAQEAMKMRPQGRTSAALRLLTGDLAMKDKKPEKAAAEYLIIIQFHNDKDLKPLALHKASLAFQAANNESDAEKYTTQLKQEFPKWQAPSL